MRKIIVAIILVLAIVALSVSVVMAQVDQAEIDEVFEETEEIRGLTASSDVKVDYMNSQELKAKVVQDFEEENPEEEIRDAQDIMVMLGFIPKDLDLVEFYIDLLTEQIAGFYDSEDDSLYLISEDQTMSAADRYTLSHELVHYLQDQNFDLMRPPFHDPDDIPEVEETDDDASFAATCLVEGDAMITSDLWMTEYFTDSDYAEYFSEGADYSTEVFDSAPDYIRDSLIFPYIEGQNFTDFLYNRNGFDAIDAAYSKPPTTTEQIYHPEKYIRGEGAVTVELPDLTEDLGDGWSLNYDNVLGEFDVYELFKPYFSSRTSEEAAEGWGGNNYHLYRSDDEELLLVQEYAWDSEDDAEEFSVAYINYVEDRFEGEVEEGTASGSWMVWSTDDYELALKKDGKNTYLVQATDDDSFKTAVGALGEEGDLIDEGAFDVDERAATEEEQDYSWVVIGGIIGLLFLGIVLVIAMVIMYRRPPSPPYQPPGGPPYYYPGGGPGSGHGGYGGAGGPGPGVAPWGGGQAPPGQPYRPPPPPPSTVPPPPGTPPAPPPAEPPQPPTVSE